MDGPEPARMVRLAIVGLLLAVATAVLLAWPGSGSAVWLRSGGAGLVVLAVGGVAVYVGHRATTASVRGALPAQFVETDRGLAAPVGQYHAYAAMLHTVTLAFVVAPIAPILRAGYDSDPAGLALELVFTVIGIAMVAGYVLTAFVAVVFAWRGVAIELTPIGVRTHGPWFDRLIPWDALAYGGPPRPALNANFLDLVIARPELVERRVRGFGAVKWRPRHRLRVMLSVQVHPWFVADAIRWYVEHPAERGSLGMRGAQNRLIAALTNAQQPAYAWSPSVWKPF